MVDKLVNLLRRTMQLVCGVLRKVWEIRGLMCFYRLQKRTRILLRRSDIELCPSWSSECLYLQKVNVSSFLSPSFSPIYYCLSLSLSLSLCSLPSIHLTFPPSLSLCLYLSLSLSLSFSLLPPPFTYPPTIQFLPYKFFSLSTDLMSDKVFHREIADMITSGCRKTIVILSPDYVQSSWCNYEANLVINRSPGTCNISWKV